MINITNLKSLLRTLGFIADGDIYEKKFPAYGSNVSMLVDFGKNKLVFPEGIAGREKNDGFNAPENIVVFECVHRLLEKGYRPEHIELEKEWHLGHDSKSGRADICVTDDSGSMLLIIECKTWGKEFEKALKDTYNDGAQLFSYWQQEQSTRWLVLYSSIESQGSVQYVAQTICCSDDANILLLAKKDKSIKLYKDANTTEERFEVWDETYSKAIHEDLIFSEDSVAYQVGVRPLRKKNLLDFSPDDKIVNKFEEILRHNNVSDKENAFNRLIALFICKLVDESTKDIDDIVEFQYKPGTDTYETLQDRLQRLHRDGMEKFMGEEIYYVSASYPEWLFSTYTGADRKNAIANLQKTIRILKFYSNNDFAFKDVHNEELFYQNGKILVEMVQLFQRYRIVYPSKHQFLGDLFEQLLNKGFKQNEGQFFTPMPITRFIWDSLPVTRMVNSERGEVYPKIIDYACGPGHFLTEAIEAINHFVARKKDNSWAHDHIFGIEKDYRLARVAKISLFMNGAGEGNIIFGDGLENVPEKNIKNESFDILVANPPYSVKDFKQHLKLKNNSFTLLDKIGMNGGEIETLFVERIEQLLKPTGVAAVILPSSILSNETSSYIGARELLLKNFYIHAIVALGSKTFGATGTNTVILFLEKFNEPPKKSELYSDSVEAIMTGKDLRNWQDQKILSEYLKQIKVEDARYSSFISKKLDLEFLSNDDYFRIYVNAFSDSPEAKNLTRARSYKKMSVVEQKRAYLDKFYSVVQAVEAEKLFYFSLVYQQSTVLIKAPVDNNGQKNFLGYDWSNRKGNEGIQIIVPGGKMYDDSNREAVGTLAHAIRRSFNGEIPTFSETQKEYASVVRTKDMFDFLRSNFSSALRLSFPTEKKIRSKYPIRPVGEMCEVLIGGTPSRNNPNYFTGENLWVSISEMRGQVITDTKEKITDEAVKNSNVKLVRAGTTLLSFKLSIGKTAIAGEDLYTNEAIAALVPKNPSEILDKYLFWLFTGSLIDLKNVGDKAFGKSLNSTYLKENVNIPIPPVEVQQQIIDACEEIGKQYKSTRMSIESYRKRIEELFNQLDIISQQRRGGGLVLSDNRNFDIFIGKRVLNKQLSSTAEIPVFSANVKEPFGYISELFIEDFTVPSVLWGIDGDWMTAYMPENIKFYPTDHCGVLRCKTPEVNPRYLTHVLEREGRKAGFSRAYRASIDRIQGISFFIADRKTQDEIIGQIEKLEKKILPLESNAKELTKKINESLRHYLIEI